MWQRHRGTAEKTTPLVCDRRRAQARVRVSNIKTVREILKKPSHEADLSFNTHYMRREYSELLHFNSTSKLLLWLNSPLRVAHSINRMLPSKTGATSTAISPPINFATYHKARARTAYLIILTHPTYVHRSM